jgi:hypothetical protein
MPVLSGPNNDKLCEAGGLISSGGAVSFDNFETFYAAVEKYLSDNAALSTSGEAFTSYLIEYKTYAGKVLK